MVSKADFVSEADRDEFISWVEARLVADARLRFMLTDLCSLAPPEALPAFTEMLLAFASCAFIEGAEATLDGELARFRKDEGRDYDA